MDFIPNTAEDVRIMLEEMNISSLNDLFNDMPAACRTDLLPELPGPLSEQELLSELDSISRGNRTSICFLGAGCYNHYIPSFVKAVISRGEFSTAYTPYQPEISQGTLQAVFEYQSMI